jgi:hypothetical protein
MRPETIPSGAGALSRRELPRLLLVAVRAWRGITLRQWAWTTVIALVLLLATNVGVLPVVLNAVPNLLGGNPARVSQIFGWGEDLDCGGVCLLLAIRPESAPGPGWLHTATFSPALALGAATLLVTLNTCA